MRPHEFKVGDILYLVNSLGKRRLDPKFVAVR